MALSKEAKKIAAELSKLEDALVRLDDRIAKHDSTSDEAGAISQFLEGARGELESARLVVEDEWEWAQK